MARGNTVAIGVSALILGIVAIALSFAAYSNRIKAADVSMSLDGLCTYPSSSAFALGIVAALCLLIEQILISAGSGCFCCRGNSCPSNCGGVMSLILFILSWLTFVVAFMGLIFTAIVNKSSFLASSYPGSVTNNNLNDTANVCYVGKDNLFLGAAIWCIICVVLGLVSYFLLNACGGNRQRGTAGNFANEQGVAMAQPMPPAKAAPGQY